MKQHTFEAVCELCEGSLARHEALDAAAVGRLGADYEVPKPCCACVCVHARVCVHMKWFMRTHMIMHMGTHRHAGTHARARIHMRTHTQHATRTRTHTHTQNAHATRTRTRTRTRTHTHTRARTRTRTRTRSRRPPSRSDGSCTRVGSDDGHRKCASVWSSSQRTGETART